MNQVKLIICPGGTVFFARRICALIDKPNSRENIINLISRPSFSSQYWHQDIERFPMPQIDFDLEPDLQQPKETITHDIKITGDYDKEIINLTDKINKEHATKFKYNTSIMYFRSLKDSFSIGGRADATDPDMKACLKIKKRIKLDHNKVTILPAELAMELIHMKIFDLERCFYIKFDLEYKVTTFQYEEKEFLKIEDYLEAFTKEFKLTEERKI